MSRGRRISSYGRRPLGQREEAVLKVGDDNLTEDGGSWRDQFNQAQGSNWSPQDRQYRYQMLAQIIPPEYTILRQEIDAALKRVNYEVANKEKQSAMPLTNQEIERAKELFAKQSADTFQITLGNGGSLTGSNAGSGGTFTTIDLPTSWIVKENLPGKLKVDAGGALNDLVKDREKRAEDLRGAIYTAWNVVRRLTIDNAPRDLLLKCLTDYADSVGMVALGDEIRESRFSGADDPVREVRLEWVDEVVETPNPRRKTKRLSEYPDE